ncbi:MAG TPA: VCBS repeat-containing protein, partial [Candidatus Marinimicrobia bacterium]|nr:VCBS repeat-containing protein [Candidatus Neomarinimicrobiota bacterium]
MRKILSVLTLGIGISFGQKIVHMNGTYDLDGDALLEFIALELDPNKDVFPTTVRYYEIDADGYQTLIWEFTPPLALEGHFVDAQIGDMDGDGAPELALVMNLSRFGDNATPHVFVATYSWDGAYFSELPSATLDVGKENRSLRCNNFQLLDQDADGDQELVLALGSPFRGFAIVNASPSGLSLTKKVRPNELLVGSGLLYVGVVDYDGDGYDDVLALSPEGHTIKAQPFYNIGGVFDSGHLVRKKIDGLSGILPYSIELTDWDADGFFDVMVPFNSGDIAAFTLTPATLVIDEVPVNPGPLSQVALEDFNQDTYQDMLMLSSDINALTLVSGEDSGVEGVENAMRHIPSEMQVFAMVPMSKAGQYTGNVLVSGWDGKENSTYIIQLGKISDRLDQGYLITSDFISNRLSNLLSNVQDDEPAIPEVYIEVLPDEKEPLQPQQAEKIITDLGQSPGSYIPNTLTPEQKEGKVLKEQPKASIPKKVARTLEQPKRPRPKETV